MRIVLVSLTTFTSPYNRGVLHAVARRAAVEVIAGDVPTLWSMAGTRDMASDLRLHFVRPRFGRSWATAMMPNLRHMLEAFDPDVVHFEGEAWQLSAIQTVRAANAIGVPVVVHFAENGPQLTGWRGAARRVLARWTLQRANYAVGWSTEATSIAAALAPNTPRDTMPATGVSIGPLRCHSSGDWFGTGAGDLPKIAFAGRLTKEKGIADALFAIDELRRVKNVRFAIAGAGPLASMVVDWVGQREDAHFHGLLTRDQTIAMFAAADLVLIPSLRTRSWVEQFGKTAIEAMAVGTPVIAYRSGALPEVVCDGGVLVPEGDRAALVSALLAFFNATSTHRHSLCLAARSQAARFSDETLGGRLLALWGHLAVTAGLGTGGSDPEVEFTTIEGRP